MRKFFTVLLLAIISSLAFCQEVDTSYVPFSDNCIWSVNNTKYKTFGDTTLNGNKYLKLYKHQGVAAFDFDINQAEYLCAIRNDTLNKKVYFAVKSGISVYSNISHSVVFTTTENQELLFYDFSLNTNDTVTYYQFEEDGFVLFQIKTVRVDSCEVYAGMQKQPNGASQSLSIVYSDTVVNFLNSEKSKMIFIHDIGEAGSYEVLAQKYWIEGVGGCGGFEALSENMSVDGGVARLLCFSKNEELLYRTDFDISDDDSTDCFNRGVGGSITENFKTFVSVFPNPANDFLNIDLSEISDFENLSVQVYDLLGQCVKTQIVNGSNGRININDLKTGMYLLSMQVDGESYWSRFVKE